MVSWVGLQCMIVVLPDHIYLFSYLVHLSWQTEQVAYFQRYREL